MLAQTIQISFSSYAADTIRIHTGETGREILFVPDMEISGNYSADFIVIKPDDTFVIAAATITDGKINVVIPEQAGAVAGAGHYILKIYDSGEVCIYSASGGFMVDDHLLSDGMIESVAEAYGYRFPQDFAVIDDDITALDKTWSSEKISEMSLYMIDDDNVLYNKTWSSEKISYELGNAPGFHVFTTTEQPYGRWIDGSTVYEKTFVFSYSDWQNKIENNAKMSFELWLPRINYDKFTYLDGYITANNVSMIHNPINYPNGSTYVRTNIQRKSTSNNGYPFIFVDMTYSSQSYYDNRSSIVITVTIRYTKNE